MEDNEEFQNDIETVDEIIYENVFPILDKIEEDFPEQSAYYNIFINSMHVVFMQGWTKADLLQEVEDHYDIFLDNAKQDSQLH